MTPVKRIKNENAGKILRCRGAINELWYVSSDGKRELITIVNAPLFFRRLIVYLDREKLDKIPSISEPENNKALTFRKKLRGKFISLNENAFPNWYIDSNLRKVKVDFLDFLDFLDIYATEINKDDLELIPL
jgi:hypothetical protein